MKNESENKAAGYKLSYRSAYGSWGILMIIFAGCRLIILVFVYASKEPWKKRLTGKCSP